MKRLLSLFILLLIFSFIYPSPLFPSKRGIVVKARLPNGKVKPLRLYSGYYALVIGCSDYRYWPKLPNPVKDAKEVKEALEKLGFKVKLVLNPDSEALREAFGALVDGPGKDKLRVYLYILQGMDIRF